MFKGRAFKLTRFITLLFTIIIIASCGGEDVATETTITNIDTSTPSQDWQLVWSDEFNSSDLDLSKWSFEINCDGGGNAEEQCYTDSPENLFIEGGLLNIVARPTPKNSELSKPYTSSRIVTKNQGDWTYGRVEVKAKPPKGQGSWAAAWMMPTDSVYGTWPLSGEIDLVEWVNLGETRADGDIDSHIHGTLHYGPMQGSNHSYTGTEYPLPNGSPEDDFNLYAIEWEEGEIRWYVNDVLYAYQRDSEITYRASDGAASGLSETGWYTQSVDDSGDKTTLYQNSPYDQNFFLILNNAVGGNWAGRTHQAANYFMGDDNGTIAQGVDNSAYLNGNAFQVDYVRVYQCAKDLVTGKGCATISADYYDNTYIRGGAPVPIPPIIPVPVGVDLFTEEQSVWDIVGSGVEVDSGDTDYGSVVEFTIDNELSAGVESGLSGAAYDGSLLPDEAYIEFDLKVLSLTSANDVQWFIKVEFKRAIETPSNQGKKLNTKEKRSTDIDFVKLALEQSLESEIPVEDQWQHYTFSLGDMRVLGLDATKIIAIKVFPSMQGTDTAVYQIDNVTIGAGFEGAKLQLFADQENNSWPMWDDQVSKGVSSVSPVIVEDEDPDYGSAAEFFIYGNSVVGFTSRQDQGGSGYAFDASSLAINGAIEFDLKLIEPPENPNAPWYLKIESNGGTNLGGTAVDFRLPTPPVQGQWTSYSVSMNTLLQQGLDISAIDIALIFPQWGQGDGAKFRVDNMIIHSTISENIESPGEKGPDNTLYQNLFTLYDDQVRTGWTLWDCCAYLPQVEAIDDLDHDMVVEFTIGEGSDGGSVVGFWGRNSGETLNLAPITNNGVLRFDLKIETMPEDETTNWLLKVESSNTTGNTFAELNLKDSLQGAQPSLGEWQSYSFPLNELAGAGLNLTEVDLVMMFPEWGKGLGSIYRLDNVFISIPESDESPYDNSNDSDNDDTGNDSSGSDNSGDMTGELLVNAGFDGVDSWGGTDGMADSISDGVFSADVAQAGNAWDVSLKQNLTLLAETDYVLSFDARSDDGRDIIAGLGLDAAPWTNAVETVSLTNEWTRYTLNLTTAGFGGENNRLFFDMGAAAGQVQLDNVSLVTVSADDTGNDSSGSDNSGDMAGELLVNAGFDGVDSWGGTDGMAESITDGIFSADVAQAGNAWDVSLKQNLTLLAETDYVLSFDARSDDGRDIIAGLGLDAAPWTNAVETVSLSNEWTRYTLNLTTAGFGGENNRLFFDMGAAAGQVQLDNVSLVTVSADDTGNDSSGSDNSGDMTGELLVNAGFDGVDSWGGTDGMADSISDGVFSADVAQAGNAWDVSLKQNLTLLAETDYVLSFDARSDDGRDIIAGLGLDAAPWTNAVETVSLSNEWTRYTLNLTTAGFGGENNRLFFDMGAAAGQVQLDNVSLIIASADNNVDAVAPTQTSGIATIDFETVGNDYSWQTFENDSNPGLNIVINPAQDGVNDSVNVAKVTALTKGQPWAGVQSAHGEFGPLTLDITNSTIKIMVYKSVISDVGIKFAIANNGAQPEIKVANTLVDQWEELTFDFAGYIGLVEAINIDQIIIFPDFDTNGRSQDNIVYFDNIRFE